MADYYQPIVDVAGRRPNVVNLPPKGMIVSGDPHVPATPSTELVAATDPAKCHHDLSRHPRIQFSIIPMGFKLCRAPDLHYGSQFPYGLDVDSNSK